MQNTALRTPGHAWRYDLLSRSSFKLHNPLLFEPQRLMRQVARDLCPAQAIPLPTSRTWSKPAKLPPGVSRTASKRLHIVPDDITSPITMTAGDGSLARAVMGCVARSSMRCTRNDMRRSRAQVCHYSGASGYVARFRVSRFLVDGCRWNWEGKATP